MLAGAVGRRKGVGLVTQCGRGQMFGGKGGAGKFASLRGGAVAFWTGWRLEPFPRKPREGGAVLSAPGRGGYSSGRPNQTREASPGVPGSVGGICVGVLGAGL